MKRIYLIGLIVILSLQTSALYSQSIERSVIGSSGNVNEASGLNVSWTIGETIVDYKESELILSQGFQQSGEASTLTIVSTVNQMNNFYAYPNPFYNEIYLQINKTIKNNDIIKIFDQSGRVFLFKKGHQIINNKINTVNIPVGCYFIQYTSGDKIGTSKILKIKK